MGAMLIVMPQMFFSGTIIPISHSTGLIGVLTKLMPLTYITDFARGVYYWKTPVYNLVVVNNPFVNIIIISAFFILFTVVGTIMYTKAEKNR
jgi:ABC-2 type transport system permease protein